MSIDLVMPSNHLILCFPLLLLSIFPRSESFPMIQLFTSSGQGIGASASASVLPMNIHDWSPLEWTGLISLQSKGLSRVFSNITVRKHQFFGALWCKVEHIGLCSEGAMQSVPLLSSGWVDSRTWPKGRAQQAGRERERRLWTGAGGKAHLYLHMTVLMTASRQLLCSLATTSYFPAGKHPRMWVFFPLCLLVERCCWWSTWPPNGSWI